MLDRHVADDVRAWEARREEALLAALPDALDSLTERQREVVELAAQGQTHEQIAAELDVAKGTVAAHAHRSKGKLVTADFWNPTGDRREAPGQAGRAVRRKQYRMCRTSTSSSTFLPM